MLLIGIIVAMSVAPFRPANPPRMTNPLEERMSG
jgi:hypothetical protein